MVAVEALEAIKEGVAVALYWPDCEMFKSIGNDAIGLFLPGYSEFSADTMTYDTFLKNYANSEFVIYEFNKGK